MTNTTKEGEKTCHESLWVNIFLGCNFQTALAVTRTVDKKEQLLILFLSFSRKNNLPA